MACRQTRALGAVTFCLLLNHAALGRLPRPASEAQPRHALSASFRGAGEACEPESIPSTCGYGFRPSPLSRLGRNDELKALAPSNTSSFPRRVFCARVLHFGFATPIEGVAEGRGSAG